MNNPQRNRRIHIILLLKSSIFVVRINKHTMEKDINRIKVVLVEKKRTGKWLAEQLGKDPATVSKWCTNAAQPSLETLLQIAKCLEVEVKDLLNSFFVFRSVEQPKTIRNIQV